MEDFKTMQLKSYDGELVTVNYQALLTNRFFFDLLEDQEVPSTALEMTNELLKKSIIENVMKYCEFAYKNHPPKIQKPIKQASIYDITSPFYANFASQFADDSLCEMILAANYLNNEGLLQLLSAKLACDLKNKSVEEIRTYFNIVSDYTPDEIKRLDEQKEEAKEIFDLEDD